MPPLRLLKVEPKMVIKVSNLRWGQIQYSKNSFCIKANIMSKSFLISNLLLGEKTLRACAPNSDSFLANSPADSDTNSGGNHWDALRASRILASKKPLSSLLVCLLYQVRTYFQNKWCGTHEVRGGVIFNFTLRYEFRHGTASAPPDCRVRQSVFASAVPYRPHSHRFSCIFVGAGFLLNWMSDWDFGRVS